MDRAPCSTVGITIKTVNNKNDRIEISATVSVMLHSVKVTSATAAGECRNFIRNEIDTALKCRELHVPTVGIAFCQQAKEKENESIFSFHIVL